MKTSNQKFKFLSLMDEGKERCPQSFEAWEMESSSRERRDFNLLKTNPRDVVESNKIHQSSTLDIPA